MTTSSRRRLSRRGLAVGSVILMGPVGLATCTSETTADGTTGSGGSSTAAGGGDGVGGAGASVSSSTATGGGPPGMCGDGVVQPVEECDDGGNAPDDGCDAMCDVEDGYTCDGAPSTCEPICGDGLVVGDEGCDDDGTEDDDGCSATCTVEDGWACDGAPSVCDGDCGDGEVIGTEACDYGDTDDGDGCSSTCQLEPGFHCDDDGCAAVLWLGIGQGGETGPLYRYDIDQKTTAEGPTLESDVTGIAFDAEGTLWAITGRFNGTQKLLTIDTSSGAVAEVADVDDGGEGGNADITFVDDTLFTFTYDFVDDVRYPAIIDLVTGGHTLLDDGDGVDGFTPRGSGIAANADGDLYWADDQDIYAVDTETGTGTFVGTADCFTTRLTSMTFRDGVLYGVSEDLELGVISTEDGSCTVEATVPADVDAIASDWP